MPGKAGSKATSKAASRYASEDETGSGKENLPPRIRKKPSKSKGLVIPTLINQAKSSLPAAQEAARVEEIAADTRVDRMAIWVKNVESEQISSSVDRAKHTN